MESSQRASRATRCSQRPALHAFKKGASMTRNRSITLFAGVAALVVAASAAGCGGGGRSAANGRTPLQAGAGARRPSASPTRPSARSSSTRRVARSTCSSATRARRARAPALAPSSGRPFAPRQTDGRRWANASTVATSARSDGEPQVTYNGHPLYLFSADRNAGDTNGQGVNAFGGLWYVVSSSGDAITTPVGSGGGFGY